MDFSSESTVTHEFSDKVPTAEYQIAERRVVHLPGNVTHTTEWWHQFRQDGSHTPATRASAPAGDKLVRRLKVIIYHSVVCALKERCVWKINSVTKKTFYIGTYFAYMIRHDFKVFCKVLFKAAFALPPRINCQ